MDEYKKRLIEIRINKTIESLKRNNMEGYYAKNQNELFNIIDNLLKDSKIITAGGSMTLYETGVVDHLHLNYEGCFLDRYKVSPEERNDIMRKAFTADTFMASVNALTENGELYNVDGYGNRVAAMIFGPKQVILIVGYNKIVGNLDAARERVKKTASPLNAMRLHLDTPCVITGECADCRGDSRLCSSFVVLSKQAVKNRIKVIIIPNEYGY